MSFNSTFRLFYIEILGVVRVILIFFLSRVILILNDDFGDKAWFQNLIA